MKKNKEELLNENLKLREENEQLNAELEKYKLNELKKKKTKSTLKKFVKKEEIIENKSFENEKIIIGSITESEVAQFIDKEEKARIEHFYRCFNFFLIKDPEIVALLELKKGVDYSLHHDPEIQALLSIKKSELTQMKEQLKNEGKNKSAIYRLIEEKEGELQEVELKLIAHGVSCDLIPYAQSNHPAKHIFPKPPVTPLSIGDKIGMSISIGLSLGFVYLIYKFATW